MATKGLGPQANAAVRHVDDIGVSPEELEDVRATIHGAALNPGRWQEVLERIEAIVPGVRLSLIGTDRLAPHLLPVFHYGFSTDATDSFVRHFQFIDPWLPGWSQLDQGEIALTRQLFDENALLHSEFYNDWVRVHGDILAGAGMTILRDATRAYYIGGNIERGRREQDESRFVEVLQQLAPTMRHALEVNRVLLEAELRVHAARAGGDGRSTPMLVVDEARHVCFANFAGTAELAGGGLVRVTGTGLFCLTDARAQQMLDAQLVQKPRRAASLTLDTVQGKTDVHLIPIGPRDLPDWVGTSLNLPAGPSTLVLLRPHTNMKPLAKTRLSQEHCLTEAEADVALSLADGLSPSEIAAARMASPHTVRNQIKSILMKTGCRRQSEIVALVLRHKMN